MKKNQIIIACLFLFLLGTFAFYSCSKQASEERINSTSTSRTLSSASTSATVCDCGRTFSGTFNSGYQFRRDTLNLTCTGSGSTIKAACTYSDVNTPSRFTIYDKNHTLVATTSWLGVAGCYGPWGSSLNNPVTSKTISFTYNTTLKPYTLEEETTIIPNCTHTSVNWTVKITCTAPAF